MCQGPMDPISLESGVNSKRTEKRVADSAEGIWRTGHRHWWGDLLGRKGRRMSITICAVCCRRCPVGDATTDEIEGHGSRDKAQGNNAYQTGRQW